MADMLPRLFFDHFRETSLIAETEGGRSVAFIVSFVSPHDPEVGYVHFIGVDPEFRSRGLGREAYAHAAEALTARGCTRLEAVTSPVNVVSQEFHRALGFTLSSPVPAYDGAGEDRIVMTRPLGSETLRHSAGSP